MPDNSGATAQVGGPPGSVGAAAQQATLAAQATASQSAGILGWVNVAGTPYNADPTGVADSTAGINAAIAALTATTNVLFFPPGTYKVSGALTALPANAIVVGSGEFTTTISYTAAAGTALSLNNANTTGTGFTLTATAATTAVGISMNANQATISNVTVSGFFTAISMTSAATFGNALNCFISSTVAASTGIIVAGGDTVISTCQFSSSGQMTGMTCGANDRFDVSGCVFKSCLLGVGFTATSAAGSTSFSSCTFDACTTGMSITPGTGNSVQNLALVGFTIDSATTGISIAPTGSGTIVGIDMDGIFLTCTVGLSCTPAGTSTVQGLDFDGLMNGCTTGCTFGGSTTGVCNDVDLDAEILGYTTGVQFTNSAGPWSQVVLGETIFDTTVGTSTALSFAPTATGTVVQVNIDGCLFHTNAATANGIVFNGAANSLSNMVIDGSQFFCVGATSTAVTYTAGAAAGLQFTFTNCQFGSTTNANPAPGSTNTQGQWVFRGCVGINPVGHTTSQPAASTSAVNNNMGCDVMNYVSIGTTSTQVSIGGAALLSQANSAVSARIPAGSSIVVNQVTNVSYQWFGD